MSTTAVEHLCADIVSVMLEAKAMGYDADVVARQRHPDAHSSVFIQAKAEIWKAEKAAFAATLERTNAKTIEGECVDVTPDVAGAGQIRINSRSSRPKAPQAGKPLSA